MHACVARAKSRKHTRTVKSTLRDATCSKSSILASITRCMIAKLGTCVPDDVLTMVQKKIVGKVIRALSGSDGAQDLVDIPRARSVPS